MAESPNIKVSGSLDDSQMVKAFEDQTRAMAKVVQSLQKMADGGNRVDKSYKGIDEAARKATAEQEKFLRQGQRVTKEVEVPLERYNRKVEELQGLLKKGAISQETFRRAAEKSKKEFEGTSQAIDHGVVGLGKMVIAGGLVYKTAQLIRAEWERTVALQNKAQTGQATQGMSFAQLRTNYNPDATVKNDEELEAHVQRLAKKHGLKPEAVRATLGAGFSSAGPNQTNIDVVNTASHAMSVIPGDPLAPIELTAGSLQLQQLAKVGPRRTLGFMRQLQQKSLVRSLQKINEAAIPAISASVAAGGSVEEGGELFALATKLGSDAKGDTASTATIGLINKLKQFVPARVSKDKLGKPLRISKQLREEYLAAKSSSARLKILQQNRPLGEQFLAANSFEAKYEAPFQQLVRADPETMQKYEAMKAAIDSPNAPGQRERFEKFVNADFPGRRASASQRVQESQEEARRVGDVRGARISRARASLNEVLDETNIVRFGPDTVERGKHKAAFEFDVARGVDPEEAAMKRITAITPQAGGVTKDGMMMLRNSSADPPRTKAEIQVAKDNVEKLLKDQNHYLKQIADQTKDTPGNAQVVAPAARALGRNN